MSPSEILQIKQVDGSKKREETYTNTFLTQAIE
jgi:hypothetical protein